MAVSTTINKTNASVGETITCSTMGTTAYITISMWVMNFTEADRGKSLNELTEDNRVFCHYSGENSSTVLLTPNHLEMTSLTSIVMELGNAQLISVAQSTPLSNNSYATVKDTFVVSVSDVDVPEEEVDIRKYFVNLTNQPVKGLDSVTVEIDTDYDNKFRIVSSNEYNEFRDTLDGVLDNNREEIITPQIEAVMDTYRDGTVPFPYATYSENLKKNNEVVSFEDVKDTVERFETKFDNESVKVIEYFTRVSSDEFCRNCWSETSGQGGAYTIANDKVTSQSIKKFKYENSQTGEVRVTVWLDSDYENVFIHTDGTVVSSNDNAEYEMSYGEEYSYKLGEDETVFVYALNSCVFNYKVETVTSTTINAVADVVYPVGSIYITIDDRDPAELWGGVWEQIKEKFLIGCSGSGGSYQNNTSGGNATITLSEGQMPRHTHTQNPHTHIQNGHSHSQSSHNHSTSTDRKFLAVGKNDNWMYTSARTMTYTKGSNYFPYSTKNTSGLTEPSTTASANATINSATASNKNATAVNQYSGGSQPVTIVPPYFAVHMWMRKR